MGADPFGLDWRGWSPWVWWLHGLAAYYLAGFVLFWFRFQAAERAVRRGEAGAVERFNAMLRGFPNTVFAKQFGKKPYEVPAGAERGGPPR
jgi:hypothetical protein